MDETNKPHVLLWASKCGKICRCCLANGDPRDLYEEIDAETFKDHLNLLVETDRFLPNLICQKCANFIQDVKRFRERVDSSTKLLNAIINNNNAKNQPTEKTRHSTERVQGGEILDSPMKYSDAMVIIPDEHYSKLKDMEKEMDNPLSKQLEVTPLELISEEDNPPDNVIKDEQNFVMKDMEFTEMDNQLFEDMKETETPLESTSESNCPPNNMKRRPSKCIIQALKRIGISKSQKRRIEKKNKHKIQNGRVIKTKWLPARNRDKIKNFKKVTKKLLDNSREMMKKSKLTEKSKFNKLRNLNGRPIKNNGIRINMGSKGPRFLVKNMDDLIEKALTRNSKDLVSVSDNDKNEGTLKNNGINNGNNGPIVLVKNIDKMIKNLTKNYGASVSVKDDNENRGTLKNNGNYDPIVLIRKNIDDVIKGLTANDNFVSIKDNNENGRKLKNNRNNDSIVKNVPANDDDFIPVKNNNENRRTLKNNGKNGNNGPIVLLKKNIDDVLKNLTANDNNFVSVKDNNKNRGTLKNNGKNNGYNSPIVLEKKNIDHVIKGLAANDNFVSVKDNNEIGGTLKNNGNNSGSNGPIVLVNKNIDDVLKGLTANDDNFVSVKDNNENWRKLKNNGNNDFTVKNVTANHDNLVSVKNENGRKLKNTGNHSGSNGPIVLVKKNIDDVIKDLAASGGTLVSINDIKLKSSMTKKHR